MGSEEISFSANDVLTDIKTAKPSIAIGSDGLATIMLKHLGMKGLEYLARTYNLCMNTLDIPTMWKLGKIIAVCKPGKPLNEGSSYWSVTLLSPVVKVLEALVLPFHKNSLPLADHQYGFRQNRSTTTVSYRRPLLMVETVKDRTSGSLWSHSIFRKLSTL